MRFVGMAIWAALATAATGQNTFEVTGTQIPAGLAKLNYGSLPSGIQAFDLSICNRTETKQPVASGEIYQALAESNSGLQPVGRQIMLAAILRNQRLSFITILSAALNSTAGVLSVLGATRSNIPGNVLAGAALGSMAAQQALTGLKPVLTADQVERFTSEVLESAMLLDGGSCAERTVFAMSSGPKGKLQNLSFHVR